jgi:hypothetical protein
MIYFKRQKIIWIKNVFDKKIFIYFIVPMEVSKEEAYFIQHIKPKIYLNKFVDIKTVVINLQN